MTRNNNLGTKSKRLYTGRRALEVLKVFWYITLNTIVSMYGSPVPIFRFKIINQIPISPYDADRKYAPLMLIMSGQSDQKELTLPEVHVIISFL